MRSLALALLYGVLAFALFGVAAAQDQVELAVVQDAFVDVLPRGWSVAEFVIEVQENYGTSIEPDVRSRFNATVRLGQDLFAVVDDLDGAMLLRPTAHAGDTRVFYGISRSQRESGGWHTTFNLENDPTASLGEVASAYSGQVLIEGSEEEAAFRAALDARSRVEHEEALRATRRAEELRAEERKGELAEAAQVAAKREASRQAEREADVAAEAHEASMREEQRKQVEAERLVRETELALLASSVPDLVRDQIKLALPAFWELGELPLADGVVAGSFAAPEVLHRFEAPVVLTEDLFIASTSFAGVPLITRVEENGATRLVRGVSSATWNGGRWQVALELDSLEGLRSGAPRDQFVAQAVVQGSAAERSLREGATDDQAELSRQLSALEAALSSEDVAVREAATAEALASAHSAVVGVALRYALAAMPSIVMELSLFDRHVGNNSMMAYMNTAATTGIELKKVDLDTGGFTGTVRTSLSNISSIYSNDQVSGTISGRHVTFTTNKGDMSGVFDLVAPDRLEGVFHFRNNAPLRAIIHVR